MSFWSEEEFRNDLRFSLRADRTIFSAKSPYQTVDIFETPRMGRVLSLDGVFMTSEADEYYYHEMLVHPALTTAPSIRRVLVIGGGDGGTVREVLRHPAVESVLMVEIDALVVQACREHLPSIGTAWEDPRLEIRFDDGASFLRDASERTFDVILLDGSDPVGPAKGLFEAEFYRNVRKRLADEGVFAMQSQSPVLFPAEFRDVQARLRPLFRHVHPCFGPVPLYASGYWTWTIASDAVDPRNPRADRLEPIERGCRYYNRDIHTAAFAVPNGLRALLREPSKSGPG